MSNDQAIILDTIDKFLEKEVRPVVKEYELADKYPHEIVSKMKELGLFGATISESYGGSRAFCGGLCADCRACF